MTVGDLKKAVEEYLIHGEEDDAVVLHLDGGSIEGLKDLEIDHEQYAFGFKPR